MHQLPLLISDLALILCVAGVVMLICQKLKQPLVLGYLLAGIIVGPYTTPDISVSDTAGIQVAAELGVVFLMFSLGLEFSFHKLRRIGGPASITGFFEVIAMLVIGYLLGIFLGWSKMESLFLGAALSISSTTIIIKALSELKLKKAHFAELVCGVLIVEDLLAILLLVGLSSITLSGATLDSGMLIKATLRLVLVIGGWFLIGYFLVPTLFRRWLNQAADEIVIVISVALCLLLVSLAAYFHYSIALGAFIMGSILAETEKSHRIETLIQPLRDIFAAVFFVSVGMLIDPAQIWEHIGTVLLITLVTISGKLITSFLGALCSREHPLTALQVGFSMAQIGEFSFIITSLGAGLGLLNPSFYPIIVAVSVMTTFTTPYLIQFSYKGLYLIEKHWYKSDGGIKPNYESTRKLVKKRTEMHLHLRGYFSRLVLNAIVVAILVIFAQRFIWPFITALIPDEVQAKVVVFIVTYILCAPFIYAMIFACELSAYCPESLTRKVILKILALGFVFIELYLLLDGHVSSQKARLLFIIGMILLSFVLKVYLLKIYHWFEKRLIGNIKKIEHQDGDL